ncbi:MAG: hydantoinase B/oxoprolinase family protein [Ardenticatenaceae bacterium]|nr:hydantoinase B/oxoprolinase family protein [Ardenticatenaceae bacterium]
MRNVQVRANIDPISLEIQWQRLIAIMDEVDNATVRTSFSTIVGESRDFACILVDQDGSSLCQSRFSPPNFCVVLPRTTRVLLEAYPLETLQDGDVLCTNDAWIGTGHLPDYIVVTPVFWQGKPVAFMGTVAHVSDVGGHRGDLEAYDVFTEGIRMPPCKLYKAGQPDELIFEIIGNNCRVPEMVLGDLRAIVGTHQVGARRLREFLADYQLADLVALSNEIHTRSEALMRERIAALPDGVYAFGLDIDGYIEIVHLHATVAVRGTDIYVDYTGTSPQTRKGAINCVYNTTYASTIYPFKCALVPTVPNNEGLFRPIHVTAPEGCILNTTYPHPVQARAKVTNNINQVLFGAVWPILGEHAQAGSGSIWPFSVSGTEAGYGTFSVHILPHGGRGAMRDLDGLVPIAFPHNSSVTPTEVMETQAPILMLKKELLADSAGPGRRRGGVGQVMTFRNIGPAPMTASIRPDKIFCAPPGLNGGQPGRTGVVRLNGESITRFPPIEFNPGDEIEMRMPGGAGFGPVTEREPERILRDLEMGYITPQGAREDYGLDMPPRSDAERTSCD